MNNTYEMADIAELGNAAQLILGQKWVALRGDAVLGFCFYTTFDDIDESDE